MSTITQSPLDEDLVQLLAGSNPARSERAAAHDSLRNELADDDDDLYGDDDDAIDFDDELDEDDDDELSEDDDDLDSDLDV
jgi:hypothetical protein